MFDERALEGDLAAVHEAHSPDAVVLDAEQDFETLPPAQAEELGLLVDSLEPQSFPGSWLPDDAPELLRRHAGDELTIGKPGDGGVAWTRQTDPPLVFVKPRLEGSPDDFVDFLIAEAFVQLSLGIHEHPLGFFEERYSDLAGAVSGRLDPAETYQLAVALQDAHTGLQTREVFAGWEDEYPTLYDAWFDAGERLEPRLGELNEMLAQGRVSVGDATEFACAAVKHAVEIPSPFGVLDSEVYLTYGSEYAVKWAEKTLGNAEED